MEKYRWIFGLFIPIAAIPIIIIILISILKISERFFNKLYKNFDERDFFRTPSRKPNPKLVAMTKIMIESLVGLTIFAVCVRVLSLPIYLLAAIEGADWTPPLFISILLIVIPYFFSGLTTFKIIQYIHRNLDLNMNTEKENQDVKL